MVVVVFEVLEGEGVLEDLAGMVSCLSFAGNPYQVFCPNRPLAKGRGTQYLRVGDGVGASLQSGGRGGGGSGHGAEGTEEGESDGELHCGSCCVLLVRREGAM